jgi:myo-inositol-1(or 4)-monophosphatase
VLNGERLHASQTSQLIHALVALDLAREPDLRARQMAAMVNCSRHIHTFRSTGSAALSLCYVAAGWLEAYLHFDLSPWDCAAGGLIVAEAGGRLSDLDGNPWRYTSPHCMATNGILHEALLRAMREQGAP